MLFDVQIQIVEAKMINITMVIMTTTKRFESGGGGGGSGDHGGREGNSSSPRGRRTPLILRLPILDLTTPAKQEEGGN